MIRSIECETVTVNPAAAEVIDPELTERYPDELPPRDPVLFEYELVNRTDENRTETVTARVGGAESVMDVDVPADSTVDVEHTVDVGGFDPGQYDTEVETTTLPVVYDTGQLQLAPLRDQTPDVSCSVDRMEMTEDDVLGVDFTVTNPFNNELQFDLETYLNGERADRFRTSAPAGGERTGSLSVRFDEPGEYDVEMSVVAGRLI